MLKIGVTYQSTAETLANLGLPPNRRPGNMGFMVHETDGRFYPAAQGGCRHIQRGNGGEADRSNANPGCSGLRRVLIFQDLVEFFPLQWKNSTFEHHFALQASTF